MNNQLRDKSSSWGFHGESVVKNLSAIEGDMGSILGPGRSHMLQSNWVRVPQLLNLCSRAQEPQLLKPVSLRTHALQQEKLPQWEACTPQLESSPLSLKLEKSPYSNEDSAQLKINK